MNLDTFLPVRLIQENSMYTYLARVTKVYDGDTLTCDIDLESYGCKRSITTIVCIKGDGYVPSLPVRLYETGEA